MKRFSFVFIGLALSGVAYLVLWPVPIDPAVWVPPASPGFSGAFSVNSKLAGMEVLGERLNRAAEDVAIDDKGRIYGGNEAGQIVRMLSDGSSIEVLASTGGRPLGLAWSGEDLIIADADKGLLKLSPSAELTVLATEYGGVPFAFTDDLDVAEDGAIYFTDASHKFSQRDYKLDLIEHRPNGRLLRYLPASQETELLLDQLYFANGVALAEDGSFVLVVETSKYRVRRLWLSGPRAGETDLVLDNLPGFPDGVSRGANGVFWVAIPSPRTAMIDRLLLPSRFWPKVAVRLPRALQPKPERYGFVVGFDAGGKVLHNLQDPAGGYEQITSVEEHSGFLYFGSLEADGVGRMVRPPSP